MLQKMWLFTGLVATVMVIAACGGTGVIVAPEVADVYQDVDPIFREYYELLGGADILGPPISPLFERNGVRYQYTAAVMMVNDPQASNGRVFRLAALGLDLGIMDPPIPPPDEPDGRYVDGYVIHSVLLPLYDQLGGVAVVGRPITEVHYNPDKRRYEQYFENLGMYWLERETPPVVRLLHLGAAKCNFSCRQLPAGDAGGVDLPYRTAEIFQEAVERLGANFTGFPITEAYQNPDGLMEQVFECVVLLLDPAQPGRVFLRPISKDLGLRVDPLTTPSGKPGFVFIEVEDGRGYNVPQRFLDYLAEHGGLDASGLPISEFTRMSDLIYRQCFVNLCLEEQVQASGKAVIRPTQLGFKYKILPLRPLQPREETLKAPAEPILPEQSLPQTEANTRMFVTPQARELTMRVWESFAMLAPDQNQEIGVSVLENNHPLQNIEPYLVLSLPDGAEKTYYLYPTGEDGVSRIFLDKIDAPTGSLISYRVCILDAVLEQYCVKDSFLIWQNP